MGELENKIALVTGAGRSLGRETALHLARLGANVIVNYNTSQQGAEEVCKEISNLGTDIISLQLIYKIILFEI